MANKSRNVAVIGLGTFGMSIATELARMGDIVLGIDSDEASVLRLSDDIATTLQADATDAKALKECGLENYDAVVISIGENVEASILTAMNVMDLGCPTVWVKAQTETQAKILKAIGVHRVVLPEQAYGVNTAHLIHNPMIKDFMSFGDGNFLVEIDTSNISNIAEVLDEDDLRQRSLKCVGIYINGKLHAPDALHQPFEDQATILLFGKRSDLRKFADAI